MYSFALFPLTTRATRITDSTATLIDQIWTSQVDNNVGNFIVQSDISDHYPIFSQFKQEVAKSDPKSISKSVLSDIAVNYFHHELDQITWDDIFTLQCPNEAFTMFFKAFNIVFQRHFPFKQIRVNKKQNTSLYITPTLTKSIKEKNRLARLANKWPMTYKEIYKRYRNNLTKVLRASKNQYYKNMLQDNQGNPKTRWKTINSLLGRTNHSQTSTISLDPQPVDIPTAFNEHFINLGNIDSNPVDHTYTQYLKDSPVFSMYMSLTEVTQVTRYLKTLDSNSAGYDEIPPKILKFVAASIALPITHIINLSLKKAIFHDHLKIAKVIPLHKSGDKTCINKYRPISILSAFNKVFEKIISTRLINYLEKNNLLTKYQHGFQANHSTETALLHFVNNIYKSL